MATDLAHLQEFLKWNDSVRFVRLYWLDYSNVLKARFVPKERCLRIAKGLERAHLSQGSMLTAISTGTPSSLSDYHETWFLEPDWQSIRLCGSQTTHATVMSFVEQKDAEKSHDKCPRTLLNRSLESLKTICGGTATIGFEIEITFLDKDNKVLDSIDRLNGYSRPAGLRGSNMAIVEEIVDAFHLSSIPIHHYHAELANQLEIALGSELPLQAIDSLLLAQETIRTICVRHNIKATMTPKPTLTGPSNGLHLHLSVDEFDDGDNGNERNFLAGTLDHMVSLCAIGMANYDGYTRSHSDAAGEWIAWGTVNRDVPVRKISDRHWEFRMLDATANPYMFVAGVIFAGIDGLDHKTELVWKDCKFFPNDLSEERRKELGMSERMPTSFGEALGSLKRDEALRGLMGEDLLRWYMSVKMRELEGFKGMTDEQRRLRFLDYY